jgi:hypothetical protein
MGIVGISQGKDTINHVEVNDTAVPTTTSRFFLPRHARVQP